MHKDPSGKHIHHHDNYEAMAQAASERFAAMDHDAVAKTLGIKRDEDNFYVSFLADDLLICLEDGTVWRTDGTKAPFNQTMAVLDFLGTSTHPVRQSGTWCSLEQIASTAGASPTNLRMFDALVSQFAGRTDALARACEDMGGVPKRGGDVSYLIPILPDFYTWMQFWDADEEFPQSMRFLFDQTVTEHFHYETLYYLMGDIIKRLADAVNGA